MYITQYELIDIYGRRDASVIYRFKLTEDADATVATPWWYTSGGALIDEYWIHIYIKGDLGQHLKVDSWNGVYDTFDDWVLNNTND